MGLDLVDALSDLLGGVRLDLVEPGSRAGKIEYKCSDVQKAATTGDATLFLSFLLSLLTWIAFGSTTR